MRKILTSFVLLCASILSFPQSQNNEIKRGWNFGFLPAVAYDSDLGIYYGIIINPFDYGDGSVYPNYLQSVFLQVSGYSGGSSEHILEYESYTFLPGAKFSVKMKYQGYKAYPFYGFNGNAAFYNRGWEDEDDPAYKTRVFYRVARKNFRLMSDIQDTIGDSRFQWHAGISINKYRVSAVDVEKMNRKLPADRELPDTTTLYEKYCEWGIIEDSEKNGGLISNILLGLIYDSRNKLTCPDKGLFTEVSLRWTPSFISQSAKSCISMGLVHRHYLTIMERRLIFAYRIWLNVNLYGSHPFYARQLLPGFSGNEGYGGYSTLRGVLMQRIVTDNFLLGTAELRSRLINFRFINQNWYIGAVVFSDMGKIIKPVKVNFTNVPPEEFNDYFRPDDKSIHKSAGGGLKLAMNENFVLSAEYAVPFSRQDGTSGLYLGLNYQF